MTGTEITSWREGKGWAVEEASIELGLSVTKLKILERAKTLNDADERLISRSYRWSRGS